MTDRERDVYKRQEEQMVATRERNRLAREIHDTLGHALTGIITGAEACAALMDVAPEAAKQQMQAITEVARQGITEVRRSVNALRPDALEKDDLEDAIKQTIDEMRRVSNVEKMCIRDRDKIIIISTHIVSDIEYISDQVIIMKKGRFILQGKMCIRDRRWR